MECLDQTGTKTTRIGRLIIQMLNDTLFGMLNGHSVQKIFTMKKFGNEIPRISLLIA